MLTKKELRSAMKRTFGALDKNLFIAEGAAASKRLAASALWKQYNRVLIYLSMPDEPDTSTLLETAFREGKDVYSPKVESETSMRFFRVSADESSWVRGAFDIREPAGREEDVLRLEDGPVLVVSPGLAFDRQGNRMGRGRGYYDRFYEKLFSAEPRSAVCALCMRCALVDEVPTDKFDRKVNAICTQDEFIEINGQ